jgi:hypothetical protein
MRGKRYCYFHRRERARVAKMAAERRRQRWFESVDLNDAKAVQRALREVVVRVLEKKTDQNKAGQLLNELSAAVSLRRLSR